MNISHNQIFWRLMWKEYRSQRGLWIGVAVLAVFVQAVMLAVLRNEREVIASLYGVAWFLPILYALASSAVLFAAEKEDGTFELLRTLPVTPLRLFVGKMSFCLVTCVGMILLLNVLAWIMASGNIPSLDWRDATNLAEFFPAVLVVGVFFSLMMNRVLNVLVATILTVMVLNLNDMHLVKWTGIAAFLLADVWLVRRWFLDGSLVQERIGELVSRLSLRVPFLRTAGVTQTKAETSPLWWRTWKRALWLEYRHSRRTIFVWFPLALLLIAISRATYNFIGVDFSYIIVPVAPLFLGLAVFRGHQQEGRIRFLTEQGVPPQLVWANAQLVWLGLTGVLLLCVWGLPASFRHTDGGVFADLVSRAVHFSGIGVHDRISYEYFNAVRQYGFMLGQDFDNYWGAVNHAKYANYMIRFYVWWAAISYLAGQLCSLKFSRTVVATVAGIILAVTGCFWLSLMDGLPVPFGLSVAPILVFWIVMSFVGLRRWSLGQSTGMTKLRTAAMFAGFHAVHLLTIISFRIYEVPDSPAADAWVADVVSSDKAVKVSTGLITPAERLYMEADSLVQTSRPGSMPDKDVKYPNGPAALKQADAKWYEDHHAAVPVLVEAIRAKGVPNQNNLSSSAIYRFKDLLKFSVNELIEAGNLDAALIRIEELFKFAELIETSYRMYPLPDRLTVQGWYSGMHTQQDAYSLLVQWAAHSQQTAEQIRDAIALEKKYSDAYPSIEQAWQTAYRQERGWITEVRDKYQPLFLKAFQRLPWEQARLLRIMDQEAYSLAERLKLIGERSVLTHPRWHIDWSDLLYDMRYGHVYSMHVAQFYRDGIASRHISGIQSHFEMLLMSLVNHLTYYRTCRLRLELMAQRLEQGTLPSQLTATLATLNPIDLIDPWSGDEFGYSPNGIPQAFRGANDNPIAANTPFLWSVMQANRSLTVDRNDHSLVYLAVRGGNDYDYKNYRDEKPETSPLYRHDGIFPIPAEQ